MAPIKSKLTSKFILLISSIISVGFISLGIFFLHNQKVLLLSDAEELATALTTNLAANSVYGLITHDKKELKKLIDSLGHVRDIKFSWIEDNKGNILVYSGELSNKKIQKLHKKIEEYSKNFYMGNKLFLKNPIIIDNISNFSNLLISMSPVVEQPLPDKEALFFDTPIIKDQNFYLGKVVIGISLNRINKNLKYATIQSLFIIMTIAIISLFITILMLIMITRPLSKLKNATVQVMQGKIPDSVNVSTRDEIGELAEAFNKMIHQVLSSKKALELANRELEQVNLSLEEKVRERTEALRNTVAELTAARDEIEKAYHEMKLMHDAKTTFLRTASHELRTPLTAIKANLDYMYTYLRHNMSGEMQEIIEAARKNCKNMQKIVEDMLKIVRIDSNNLPLEVNTIKLKDIILQVISELKSLQKNRIISVDIPDDLELECDAAKIHDLCFNLLSNALKFTDDHGKIFIKGNVEKENVVFSIEDNGIGISSKDIVHIFEPFYQAHQSKQGTGLGLAIVNAIIQNHHGNIRVESNLGVGTKFTVKIPLKFRYEYI
ncbi:sensory box histidine kinase/response regulator [Dissulfuribacter thermophilus]|uniref:histidine kinase n=1 Tax=Dissulfuribacter thermophilus TaxID=1156395 RepID=A0A1B9F4C3_9BACT|nr:HAMP domain-containing sensor histidine kinase [Dissulfuribacter thermophilus]OCC14591.1 sensory box histidine kinase/response regulator [Dissulfuribacter thermophilus]